MGLGNAAVFKMVPKYVPHAVGGASGLVGGLGAARRLRDPAVPRPVRRCARRRRLCRRVLCLRRAGGGGGSWSRQRTQPRRRHASQRRRKRPKSPPSRDRHGSKMSHFLDRLTFFRKTSTPSPTATASSPTRTGDWEDGYRKRWQHDKIVRSTHGVNCTGSCSWKIYVKGGIVTWETQQTDYPRTRPDLPNHEPRGCARGRQLFLVSLQRQPGEISAGARRACSSCGARRARRMAPVEAWASIVENPDKRASYTSKSRPGRLRARDLGRGQRDHRRRQRLHHQELRPGPRLRLLADSRHVDGLLSPPAPAICR